MLFAETVMAQEAVPQGGPAGAPPQPNMFLSFFPIAIIFVLFYVLIIMPQRKTQKKHQIMLDEIKPGDRVVTKGGIRGTVAQVKEDYLLVKVADGVKLEVSRSFVEAKIEKPS